MASSSGTSEQGEGAARQTAGVGAYHAVFHLDPIVAKQIVTVWHTGGVHRIGNQEQALAGTAVTELEHARVEMMAIGDQLQPGSGMDKARTDHAGFAVVQATHAVEAVHQPGGARRQRRHGGVVIRRRVAQHYPHAVCGKMVNGCDGIGLFRCQCDHLQAAARQLLQMVQLGNIQLPKQRLIVGSLVVRREVWPFQIAAE
jgi:hypothetical protein